MPRDISVPGGPARRKRLERRAEYRFGVVLVLLLVTFMVSASAAEGAWEQIVTVLLQGITLIAALVASDVPPRLLRIALVVVFISFVVSFVAIPWNGRGPAESAGFVSTALVAGAPVAIVWSVTRRKVIDIQTVLAALCV